MDDLDPTYARWRDEFGVFMENNATLIKGMDHLATEYGEGRLTDLRGLATASMVFRGYDDGLMAVQAIVDARQQHRPPPDVA